MKLKREISAVIALLLAVSGCASTDQTAASCFGEVLYQPDQTYIYTRMTYEEDNQSPEILAWVTESEDRPLVEFAYFLNGEHKLVFERAYVLDKQAAHLGVVSAESEVTFSHYDPAEVTVDLNLRVGESSQHVSSVTHTDKETNIAETDSSKVTITFKEIVVLSTPLGEFETCVFTREFPPEMAYRKSTEWYRRSDGLLLKEEASSGEPDDYMILTAIEPIENN